MTKPREVLPEDLERRAAAAGSLDVLGPPVVLTS